MKVPWSHAFGEIGFHLAVLVAGIGMTLLVVTGARWPFLFFGLAGLLLLLRSYVMLTNRDGALDYLRERATRSSRPPLGVVDTQAGGYLCALAGAIFLIMSLGAFQ